MSTEVGEFVTDGKSSESIDDRGSSDDPKRDSRAARDADGTANIIDGYEWDPTRPSTERFGESGDRESGNGEPKRTKSGRIDRRTKAGRGTPQASDSVGTTKPSGKLISLEKAILSLHDMAAGMFEIPEMSISEYEAGAMNDAILDASKYHFGAFDPKKVSIFNLLTCMVGIYGVRIMAYRKRMAATRRGKLSVMQPQPQPQPQSQSQNGITIEQYLGGMPPAEGASGF